MGEGYERVEDYWRSNGSDDAGYELVRGNSKHGGTSGGNGGTSGRSSSGFERLTFSSSSKKTDPGYETVPPRPPLPRMNHQFHDPPYARLENSKDEEMESEEGYETIPASERQNRNDHRVGGFDPGYESVPDKLGGQGSEPGYETVPNEPIHMFRDPGYETLVQNKPDPGYATVAEPGKPGPVVEH